MTKESTQIPDTMSCAICGYFCNNYHHHNNWFDTAPQPVQQVEEKDGWVRVEDGLPDDNIEVLVYSSVEYDYPHMGIDHLYTALDKNRRWDWCNDADTDKPTVTHWQPLPPPPKN